MMDPLENDPFALPDYEHTEDESFPPLPPPHSPGAGDDDAGDLMNGDDWTANLGQTPTEEAPKTVRRTVKRPLPKLDANRLTSQRGLPALRHIFDSTKFKGKGHEAEDLKTLIRQMENWAHRLFPKLQFEDFLARLETLGNKKEVQTCLKRIRMDMPILHEDFNSEEVVVQMEDNDVGLPSEDFGLLPESSPPPPTQSSMTDLSEETRQRIERNRLLALERRMAKIQAQKDSEDSATIPVSSQMSQPDLDEIPEDVDDDFLEAIDQAVELASSGLESETKPDPTKTDLPPSPRSEQESLPDSHIQEQRTDA
ncbi:TIMELESS-interacting protein [Bombina bombina]|uniref:TIMELESS-interacting protein n=1 Tax=Bombina bombina TaxID=8345 RepID=UPI00235AB946|nr:TIMELESS-interacting protein [Bombina bombina]